MSDALITKNAHHQLASALKQHPGIATRIVVYAKNVLVFAVMGYEVSEKMLSIDDIENAKFDLVARAVADVVNAVTNPDIQSETQP
jgi:hypothetical protein